MAFDIIVSMFDNTLFFIFFIVFAYGVVGFLNQSFSVGAFAAFLMFINIVTRQDNVMLTNMLYIIMVVVLFFTAFRLYGVAMNDNGVGA